jgi:hypothetical protein
MIEENSYATNIHQKNSIQLSIYCELDELKTHNLSAVVTNDEKTHN